MFKNILLLLVAIISLSLQAKVLFKIDKIKVEGTKRVEPEAILEKILIKDGSVLDTDLLKDSIKKIYSMRYFDLVEAHQNGKNLVFKVKEKPVVSRINFKGNDDLSDDDILEKIKTKKFNILDINTIKEDILNIQKLYEEKGY